MHRLARRSARLPAIARCGAVAGLPAGAPSCRRIHVRVPLPYNVEDGMGDFLPPAALKLIAEDYQQGLLDRLNEQIKGTNLENMSVAQIVISTAPHESQTLAFNYASLALNNSFFLHHLKPPTGAAAAQNHESALNDKWLNPERTLTLGGVIAAQMGSLQDLKTYVTAAATGMLPSSGFVWLVTDALGRLGVVPTYGAGTLLVAERRQHAHAHAPADGAELGGLYQPAGAPPPPPSSSSSSSSSSSPPRPTSPTSGLAPPPLRTDRPPAGARTIATTKGARPSGTAAAVGDVGARRPMNVWSSPDDAPSYRGPVGGPEGPAALDTLGRTLYPLFCVSVHEHAWMAAGYGVWGKETYLERFWTCLDWAEVRDAYARYAVRK